MTRIITTATILATLSAVTACDRIDASSPSVERSIAQKLGHGWALEAPGLWASISPEGATLHRAFGEAGRASLCEELADTAFESLQDSMFGTPEELTAFCDGIDPHYEQLDLSAGELTPIAMTCTATFGAKCVCDSCSAGLFKCSCNSTPELP
jgi:hypothetical protein